jgi:Domain of unknown function (DUF4124)
MREKNSVGLARGVVCLAGMLILSAASADVYKWVDRSGRVHYSNNPPKSVKATKVDATISVVPSGLPKDVDLKKLLEEDKAEKLKQENEQLRQENENLKEHEGQTAVPSGYTQGSYTPVFPYYPVVQVAPQRPKHDIIEPHSHRDHREDSPTERFWISRPPPRER